MSTTPIVQFGTSRFLQAHADLFVSEAMQSGAAIGSITVVQTSGDPSRSHRLRALADPTGYEVRVRGLDNGELVDTSKTVKSITAAYSLPDDLETVASIVAKDARIILSNTADAGYRPSDADNSTTFSTAMSYPAKLTWFLHRRFLAGGEPVQIMPAELIPQNGKVLCGLVGEIAGLYSEDFRTWLNEKVIWVNSLVDRIVSEPLDPAGAVAEPYALWAIEDQPGLQLPCTHPAVQVVEHLEQVESLKLFILNLGHTYLVSRWLQENAPCEFVREYLDDQTAVDDLRDLYESEVLPGFAAHGMGDEAKAYVATTIDRFKNPFLDHRLSDISQNHAEKIQRRIASFVDWARAADKGLQMPRLEAVLAEDKPRG